MLVLERVTPAPIACRGFLNIKPHTSVRGWLICVLLVGLAGVAVQVNARTTPTGCSVKMRVNRAVGYHSFVCLVVPLRPLALLAPREVQRYDEENETGDDGHVEYPLRQESPTLACLKG